jgi:tetratricopeptide (TPR) repeat protein
MFKRRAKETRFTAEQIQRWLSWLASRMAARGQTLFQVEDLRSDWVGLGGARTISMTGTVIIATVLSGVLGWLNMAGADPFESSKKGLFFEDWTYFLLFMAPIGLIHALIRARSARAAEVLEPHWPGFKRFLLATLVGAALGGVLGYVLGMTSCEIAGGGLEDSLENGADFGRAGIVSFAFLGAIGSLIGARVARVRSSPNLAVYSSLRSSLACFGGTVLLSAPFFVIAAVWKPDHNDWRWSLLLGGQLLPWIGLFVAMENGGYFLLDHFATRYILRHLNLLPWQLVRLLDTAAERLFLRRVGGSYIFVHRTLLEYFANEYDSSTSENLGDLAPILVGSVIALPVLFAYEFFILRFAVASGLIAAALVFPLLALFATRHRWRSIRSQFNRFLCATIDLRALLLVGAAIGLLLQCVFGVTTDEHVTGGSIALAVAATSLSFVAMRVGTLITFGLFERPISSRVAQILTGSALGTLALTAFIIVAGGTNNPEAPINDSSTLLWITLIPVLIGLACVFTEIDASEYTKGRTIRLLRRRRLGKALAFLVLALAAAPIAIPFLPEKTIEPKFSESRVGDEFRRVIPVTHLPQLILVQIDEPRIATFVVPEYQARLGFYRIELWRGPVPVSEAKAIKSLRQRYAFDYGYEGETIDEFLSPGQYEVIVDGRSIRVPEYADGHPVPTLVQLPALYRVLPYLEIRSMHRVVRFKETICTLSITLKQASPDAYKLTVGNPHDNEYIDWRASKFRAIAMESSEIKRNPDDAAAYRSRAHYFTWFDDYQQSVEDIDHVIELQPSDADAYIDRGNYYVNLRDYEKALSDLNVAVRLAPGNQGAYVTRAGIYNLLAMTSGAYKKGDLNNAIKDANDGLRLASDNEKATLDLRVTALEKRADAYYALGDSQKAIADMKYALSLNDHDATVYNNLGFYYNRLRKYDLALTNLNVAVELDPGNAYLHKNRGRALFGLDQKGEAKADFDEAIRLAPDLAETYWFRADLEEKQGNSTLAANDRRKAINLGYKPRGAKGW